MKYQKNVNNLQSANCKITEKIHGIRKGQESLVLTVILIDHGGVWRPLSELRGSKKRRGGQVHKIEKEFRPWFNKQLLSIINISDFLSSHKGCDSWPWSLYFSWKRENYKTLVEGRRRCLFLVGACFFQCCLLLVRPSTYFMFSQLNAIWMLTIFDFIKVWIQLNHNIDNQRPFWMFTSYTPIETPLPYKQWTPVCFVSSSFINLILITCHFVYSLS